MGRFEHVKDFTISFGDGVECKLGCRSEEWSPEWTVTGLGMSWHENSNYRFQQLNLSTSTHVWGRFKYDDHQCFWNMLDYSSYNNMAAE